MTISLPEPPSVNHAYATVKGRRVLSKAGREYKADVANWLMLARWKPLAGDVVLTIHWRRGMKSGDLSNRIKILEDAMKGKAWGDDSQVVEIHAYRSDEKDNPGVTVTVEAA